MFCALAVRVCDEFTTGNQSAPHARACRAPFPSSRCTRSHVVPISPRTCANAEASASASSGATELPAAATTALIRVARSRDADRAAARA